jgi:hypothetical protein
MNTKVLFTLSMSALFVAAFQGCGASTTQNDTTTPQWVTQSPSTKEEAGFLVRINEQQIQNFLNANPGTQGRVLNPAHGLYEVRNTDEQTLSQTFGSDAISKNSFFESLPQSEEIIPKKTFMLSFFESCRGAAEGQASPKVRIKAEKSIFDLDVTKEIEISAESLGARPDDKVEFNWIVQTENGSNLNGRESFSPTLTLSLDRPGSYQVYVIAKNTQTGVCSEVQEFRFGVTLNKPYLGKKTAQTGVERSVFEHLAWIGAANSPQTATGRGVKIAVLDSGVNYNHVDLRANIAVNEAETQGSKEDTDKNGFPGDYAGFDFANYDASPNDDTGHGTHVAGLAAGAVGGVATEAQIIPVKVLNANGDGDTGSIAAGIYYAVDRGADILCLSFGSDTLAMNSGLKPALEYARKKNVLVVAAAGNSRRNIDVKPHFPAAIEMENLVAVAGASKEGALEIYSNYGKNKVHLAAPGGSNRGEFGAGLPSGLLAPYFLAADDEARYIRHWGTSMAAPLVAGAAALLKEKNSSLTANEIRTQLMEKGTPSPALESTTVSGKVLNVEALLETSSMHAASGQGSADTTEYNLDSHCHCSVFQCSKQGMKACSFECRVRQGCSIVFGCLVCATGDLL